MNQFNFSGNLTRDPDSKTLPNGTNLCTFTVAVNGKRKDDETLFVRVTAWRQLAENCQRFLAKGRKVLVSGAVSLNQYKDSNGLPRYSMEVQADEVEFLTPRGEGGSSDSRSTGSVNEPQESNNGFVRVDDDDLPF